MRLDRLFVAAGSDDLTAHYWVATTRDLASLVWASLSPSYAVVRFFGLFFARESSFLARPLRF
jgi:hypothetical protein